MWYFTLGLIEFWYICVQYCVHIGIVNINLKNGMQVNIYGRKSWLKIYDWQNVNFTKYFLGYLVEFGF